MEQQHVDLLLVLVFAPMTYEALVHESVFVEVDEIVELKVLALTGSFL